MPKRKLGAVLLLPRTIASEIDGLRRALGVSPIERVPPHITLVPPINVREEDVDDALALARRVASDQPTRLHVTIGPVTTFSPITPVVYLSVNGPGLDAIRTMRDELDSGPLAQELSHPYVPHVTISDDPTPDEIDGAIASLTHYVEPIALEGITVLEQDDDDRMWRPIADAPFGAQTTTRTLGADRVSFAQHAHESLEAMTIGRYRPLVVEAIVEGRTVGVARGRVAPGDVAWLDELVVRSEQRGSGIGGGLARAFVGAARARDVAEIRSARGATIAGFLVKLGFVPTESQDFVLGFER
ncbi:MAG: GNAT family N-acetyltransferase [Acidimicrobiales bacterium]|nr:GNAT family N-acetyltransferase [Acidimicrobiales bacterium]